MPRATRITSAGWRDPRLWIGVAIVAASVVMGARLVGAADDSVPVWSVVADSAAGTQLTPDGVAVVRVGFVDEEAASAYLSAAEPLPGGLHLSRDVSAGELLPRSALVPAGATGLAEVPLDFSDHGVAATLHRGDRVDVYVTAPGSDAARASLPLRDVVVLDVIRGASGFGSSGGVQVLLGVPDQAQGELPAVVQAAADGRVYLVKRG